MTRNRRITALALALVAGLTLSGCVSAADQSNANLTKAAENFEVPRRVVGINAITGDVLFSVEGYCSYEVPGDATLEVICLVNRATKEVERTTLGLSDNVTFVSTQLQGFKADVFRPRVIFRPETIIPNFDLSTSANF